MTKSTLSTYDEIVSVLEALPILVREQRRKKQMSLRQAEADSGVIYTALYRLEQGDRAVSYTNIIAILRWLDT